MGDLPIDFEAKIKAPRSANGGGYPVQLSAADLMKNFVYAALDADPSLIEQTTGQGGHPQRKLKIPPVPSDGNRVLASTGGALSWKEDIPALPASGTHVLGAVEGVLTWIATEEC